MQVAWVSEMAHTLDVAGSWARRLQGRHEYNAAGRVSGAAAYLQLVLTARSVGPKWLARSLTLKMARQYGRLHAS
jgi:hypothetical protein